MLHPTAPHTVLLPNVELNMDSVVVTEVLVKPGDKVSTGQPLGSVETQKANFEIACTHDGYVQEVFISVGDEIGEKAPVCSIAESPPETTSPESSPSACVKSEPATAAKADKSGRSVPENPPGKVRASPVARKVARELEVSLTDIEPSGPNGRIMRRDVEAFHAVRQATPMSPRSGSGDDGWQEFPGTRLALIAQMETAARTIPWFSLTRQMDVTALTGKEPGITFTHRLIHCLGLALVEHRSLLTTITGSRFRLESVGVAVAMNTKSGLVAPVVREPHLLTLPEIAATIRMLKARGDAGKLKRADFENAPFALSNLGMYGVDQFQPSVFAGQCAVLGTGRAADGPAGRRFSWFTLVCDHRAVDGAEAASFLQTLQDRTSNS